MRGSADHESCRRGKRAHLFVIRLIEEELYSIDVSDNARPKVVAGDVGKLVKGLASNWNWEGLDVAGTQHQKGRGGIRRFWAVVNPGLEPPVYLAESAFHLRKWTGGKAILVHYLYLL